MQQGGGGHLWNDTKLKGRRSNSWDIFTLVNLTSTGAKVGRVLRKLFFWNSVRVVLMKIFIPCHVPIIFAFPRVVTLCHDQLCFLWNYLSTLCSSAFLLKAKSTSKPSSQTGINRSFPLLFHVLKDRGCEIICSSDTNTKIRDSLNSKIKY